MFISELSYILDKYLHIKIYIYFAVHIIYRLEMYLSEDILFYSQWTKKNIFLPTYQKF